MGCPCRNKKPHETSANQQAALAEMQRKAAEGAAAEAEAAIVAAAAQR